MPEYDIDAAAPAVIEDLARRAHAAATPERRNPGHGDSVITRVVRNDERIDTVNLERLLEFPSRPRGSAVLHDPLDFTTYVRRLATSSTTVWGHETNSRFTAVFNDHLEAGGDDDLTAGWRDHTAVLQLQSDPDWTEFIALDGKLVSQVRFAEFLQDYALAFVQPDAATLLEVATTFKAHRKAEFSQAVNLDTGDVQLTYNEETRANSPKAGQMDVPSEFVVKLSPFLGMDAVPVAARLRWTIDGGQLGIGFKLHRPDLVKRDAFAGIRAVILTGLEDNERGFAIPVLLGPAPAPIAPQQ